MAPRLVAAGPLRLRVERVAPGGEGLGRSPGGKAAFVPQALPGELVELSPVEEKPGYLRGRLLAVLEPSPERVDPPCPHHFRPGGLPASAHCGGCDWQHAGYALQLRLKREIVLDCLRRIARLEAPVAETLPSPGPWRYRNKVQVPFQARGGSLAAGFFAPGTHRVVEFEDCRVQPELAVAVLRTVLELARARGWRAYDEASGRGWLRHLYLRTNSMGQALAALVTRSPSFPGEREAVAELLRRHPQLVSLWQNVQPERGSVILGPRWRRLAGDLRMRERVGPLELEFSPGAFLQVNTPASEALYACVEEMLGEGGFQPDLLLDLYCGIGAVALWLARRARRVIGVEQSAQAVEDARANALRAGAANARFVQGRVEGALERLPGLEGPRPWAAVLDPPRAGCEPAALDCLARRAVERVVYASCNPATFARDARRLADSGYALRRVQPVDLFPQTSHVELAALFDRAPALPGAR